tara:strand:+ start:1126 stop:1650 length:525 start_codon:yes stop_codon:yes gene_type:complete
MQGESLEIFVEHLYKNLGKRRVKRNITYSRGKPKDQVDVQYGLFLKTFIECKDYAKKVPYSDFMKFVGTCRKMNARGIMVTTSDFTPRCYEDAYEYGIELINGDRLKRLYRRSGHKPKGSIRSIVKRHPKGFRKTFKRRAINYSKYGLYCTLALALYENQHQIMPLIEKIRGLF